MIQWSRTGSTSLGAGKAKDIRQNWPISFTSWLCVILCVYGTSMCTYSSNGGGTNFSASVHNHATSSTVSVGLRCIGVGII